MIKEFIMNGMMGFVVAFVLIALASGFWVLSTAYKSEGLVKTTGKILGWIIIIFALISLLDSTISSLSKSLYRVRRQVSAPVISKPGQDIKVENTQRGINPESKYNNVSPRKEKHISEPAKSK